MDKRIIFVSIIFICIFSMYAIIYQPVTAQSTTGAIINSDGSVNGTHLIERNGDIYVLTGNISGGLQIQKSNITINGAGFAIIGNNAGRGIDLSVNSDTSSVSLPVENVTITNLIINDFITGICAVNSGSNTFYGNMVANCEVGFWISGRSNNGILYNTIQDNIDGIAINFATGNNIVSRNNLINNGVNVWQSAQPIIYKNYWNDYITKYPNAVEIGNSGVGDTPYIYDVLNNFTDSQPLMQPISIDIEMPIITPSTTTPIVSPTSTVPLGMLPPDAPLGQVIIGYILAGVLLLVVVLILITILRLMKRGRTVPARNTV